VGFSTNRCLLVAAVSSASLFRPRLLSAKIAAVALSAVAMRADAEDGFTRVAASWTKQDLRHVLDDKPPLRFGDDAEDTEGSLSNRRVIKNPRFLMRGDMETTEDRRYSANIDNQHPGTLGRCSKRIVC
jgi:Ni/Co efflux regulator RcnB